MKMKRNTSPLLEDTEAIPSLLDRMPDFNTLFERRTPAEIDSILDEQLSGDKSAESRSKETTSYGSNNTSTTVSDVDRAFNDLMK
jgi:hypothetical protein